MFNDPSCAAKTANCGGLPAVSACDTVLAKSYEITAAGARSSSPQKVRIEKKIN